FFSSRRRHTRFSRDWSSDVCSSDLGLGFDLADAFGGDTVFGGELMQRRAAILDQPATAHDVTAAVVEAFQRIAQPFVAQARLFQIGRASCRERVQMSVETVGHQWTL